LGKREGLTPPSLSPHPFHIPSPPLPHIPSLTRHPNTSHCSTPTTSPAQQSSPQLLRFSLPVRQSPTPGLSQNPLLHGIPFIRPFHASPHPHPVTALDTCSALSPVTLNDPRTETKGTDLGCVGSTWTQGKTRRNVHRRFPGSGPNGEPGSRSSGAGTHSTWTWYICLSQAIGRRHLSAKHRYEGTRCLGRQVCNGAYSLPQTMPRSLVRTPLQWP
jgi:hypothetical protein